MDLRYLRYFIAVAEEMSLTRAAERLHTVQPSLSRQIRRLEEIVGTPLFNHDRRGLELTEAGRIFLGEAREILHQMNRSIMLARQGSRAESRNIAVGFISGNETQIFSRLLPPLRARYPEMQLSYHVMNEPELLAALDESEIDVAFLAGPIDHPGIHSEVFIRQKIAVVLPSSHPLARHKKISLTALAEMPMVLPSQKNSPRYLSAVKAIIEAAGVEFTSTLEFDNVLSALHAVRLGLGFCLLPEDQRSILPGSIVARPLELEPQPTIDLLIAYRHDYRNLSLVYLLRTVRETAEAKAAAK
jgi:LysR family transcriptional regulator, hca operon transcriptional activator